jgi:hypothetical protein
VYRDGVEVVASRSTVDNVEHVSLSGLGPGYYEFQVQRLAVAGSGDGETYAVAWDSDQIWIQTVQADFDHDGDVDQEDFGHLQVCLSGPGVPQTDPTCQDAKLDNDSDVDPDDLAILLQCLSGSDVAVTPDCAN